MYGCKCVCIYEALNKFINIDEIIVTNQILSKTKYANMLLYSIKKTLLMQTVNKTLISFLFLLLKISLEIEDYSDKTNSVCNI